MKKVLVVLLMAALAGSAFAQDVGFSVSGGAKLTFGADVDFGAKDEADTNSSWMFKTTDAILAVNGNAGPVSANVTLEGENNTRGGSIDVDVWHAKVDLDPLELKVGLQFLPWVQWTGIGFNGESNWGWGASAIKDHVIQATYKAGQLNAYIGLMNEGVSGVYMNRIGGGGFERFNGAGAIFPGFFVGGDFDAGLFSIGLGFGGVGRGKAWALNRLTSQYSPADLRDDDWWAKQSPELIAEFTKARTDVDTNKVRFAWIGNLHGKVNLDPISVGFNFAMYGDPGASENIKTTPGNVSDSLGNALMTGAKEDFIIEAMIHGSVALEPCDVNLSVAFVANATPVNNPENAADNTGNGYSDMKLGFSTTFKLGGGFTMTPGITAVLPLTREGKDSDNNRGVYSVMATGDAQAGSRPDPRMSLGITFGWSF